MTDLAFHGNARKAAENGQRKPERVDGLERVERLTSVSHRGSDAVISGIWTERNRSVMHFRQSGSVDDLTSTSDDDNVLSLRVDVGVVLESRVEKRSSVELCEMKAQRSAFVDKGDERGVETHLEEVHGEVDAVGISVLDLEISRPGSSGGEDNGVRLLSNGRCVDIHSNVGVGDEVL